MLPPMLLRLPLKLVLVVNANEVVVAVEEVEAGSLAFPAASAGAAAAAVRRVVFTRLVRCAWYGRRVSGPRRFPPPPQPAFF